MASKSMVVVGGSHGIGLGIVRRLVDNGHRVSVVSRTAESLSELSAVQHVPLDVLQQELSANLLPECIDGWVYCPGSINLGPFRGLKLEALRQDFDLNVVAAVKCLQAALPALQAAESASVLFFSTVAVAQGLPMHASVAAAKGAVEGLTRALAAELAPRIRVNCLAPSLTDTPLAARLLANEQKRAAMAERHPLKRIGRIDDVAAIAEFLLSDASSWISGQVIGVDGGLSTLRA